MKEKRKEKQVVSLVLVQATSLVVAQPGMTSFGDPFASATAVGFNSPVPCPPVPPPDKSGRKKKARIG